MKKNAYACIKMSYDYLIKETTKRCFLWCALYPEDHSIDTEDLVRHAWALKLYPRVESVERVRYEVLEAIDKLKASCLLLEDTQRHVKLHDVVRDVVLWITSNKESGFMIKSRSRDLNDSLEDCKAISLMDSERKEFHEKSVCPNLEFLMLNNCDIRRLCFQEMQELKVLSLTIEPFSERPISLYPLQFLGKLGSLQLENFEDFSFLGNLRTLEIFSLRGFVFKGLENELIMLENLKILDLGNRGFAYLHFSDEFLPYVICRMRKLEELYLGNMKVDFAYILRYINWMTSSTTLSLAVSSHFPEDFRFPKLKCLYLQNLPKLSHIWELPIQHVRLEALVELKIRDCPSLKSIFTISLAQSLAFLEKLKISLCGALKQIVTESEDCEEEISPSINSNSFSFPKLREVCIKECDGLEYIFPMVMARQGLPQLEHLRLHRCCQLKQLVRQIEGRTENDVLQQLQFSKPLTKFSVEACPLLSDSSVKPFNVSLASTCFQDVRLSAFRGSLGCQKHLQLCRTTEDRNLVPEANEDGLNVLTSLEVKGCKDVQCLVDTTAGNGPTSAFTDLEKLRIEDSHGLETLCKGQRPQGFLKKLKELAIKHCDKLQVVFQIPYNGEQNQGKPLLSLQYLELLNLLELRWILKGSAHSFSLQSLKVVKIEECDRLESLFSPSLIQCLVMLEQLQISGCNGLKTLIAELENNDGETESYTSLPTLSLPKLKTLHISICPKLEYALPITSAKGLPALATISISNCGELKQVFGTLKEQNGVDQDGIVHLGNLQDLRLGSLRNLSCFAPVNYILKAPALESLKVDGCPRLMKFSFSQVRKRMKLEGAGGNDLPLDGRGVLESLEQLMVAVFRNDEENQAQPLLSNLEHLTLESLRELRWIVKVPTHCVSFRSLLVLKIDRCDQLESLFSLSAIQTISLLQVLTIDGCSKLKSVFVELESSDDKIESSTLNLPNLKTVVISSCPSAEYVFPLALAGGLPCLQLLHLHDLENLSSFFAECNIVEAPALESLEVMECPRFSISIQNEANKSLSLKELRFTLSRWNMPSVCPLGKISPGSEYVTMGNFEQLFQLQSGYSISNLRNLSIKYCHGLKYIFPMMLIQNLPHLKYLSISNCEKLEQIIAIDDSLVSSSSQGPHFEKKMEFPQLERLELSGLPSLVNFSPLGSHLVFPNLISLRVIDCKKMITRFMIDYSTLAVHAKTEQQAFPPNRDIHWESYGRLFFSKHLLKEVPQYVEESEEISTLN